MPGTADKSGLECVDGQPEFVLHGVNKHDGDLEVRKKLLSETQMSDAAYIEDAVTWSKELTRMRTRCPGDLENAMRAIERDYGVDYWTLWQLRYRGRTIKDIGVTIYMRLKAAYEAECARQSRRYEHEREITETKGRVAAALVRAADALAGTEDGAD